VSISSARVNIFAEQIQMAVQDIEAGVALEKRSDRGGTPELHVSGASDGGIRATKHLSPNEIGEHPLRRHLYHREPGNA